MTPDLVDIVQDPARLISLPRPVNVGDRARCTSRIIIIPEWGSKTALGSSLVDSLSSVALESDICKLDYNISENGPPVWTALLLRGVELLDLLITLENESLPIVFICFGLGGLIVKRALTILHERYFDPSYQKIIKLHAGVAFVGTPHPTYKNEKPWPRLGMILRCITKFQKVVLAQAESEAAIVANVSKKFEEIGLEIPILSVYERNKTKISGGLFKSRAKVMLADCELCETNLKNESLVGCDVDHYSISSALSSQIVLQEVGKLLSNANTMRVESGCDEQEQRGSSDEDLINYDAWKSTVASEVGQAARHTVEVVSDSQTPRATYGSSDAFELVPLIKDLSLSRSSPKLPVFMMSPHERNPDFLERKSIFVEMDEALIPPFHGSPTGSTLLGSQVCRCFALCGLGGIGKTQLAVEYGYSRRKTFDAIFFIQADGTAKLDESYRAAAVALNLLDASDSGDLVISRNLFVQWLSNPYTQSTTSPKSFPETKEIYWLLIMDNADKLDDLRDFIPVGSQGSILITSRDPLAKSYTPTAAGMDLQPLESNDTKSLLNRISGNTGIISAEKVALESLAIRLGGLPLAIVQYGAAIKRRDLTYEETVEIVSKEKWFGDLEKFRQKYVSDANQASVADTWAVDSLGVSALGLLEVLSVLDPDSTQESLLITIVEAGIDNIETGLGGFPTDKASYYDARTELWKCSLISRNKHLQQLTIHRLTQDVVRARMTVQRFRETFTFGVRLISKAWLTGADWMTHKKTTWEVIDKLAPHALKLYSIYEERPDCAATETERQLASLIQKTGWNYYERGSFDRGFELLTTALAVFQKAPDEDPEMLADTVVSLSACTKEMNSPEQHLFYAKWQHKLRLQHPSEDILLNGMAYTQLASAYHQVGRHEEAIELARKGRAINVTSPEYLSGQYYPFYAMIYEVLPLMALKQNVEASKSLEEAIAWRESKYGKDDTKSFQLGYALHMLANVRKHQSQEAEAAELWLRAVANYRATMGKNYHRTGTVCANLGRHYMSVNQFETASIFFDEAERCHSLLSYFKPELARTTFLKAQFLEAAGSEDAPKYMEKAAGIFTSISSKPVLRPDQLTAEDFDSLVHIWSR